MGNNNDRFVVENIDVEPIGDFYLNEKDADVFYVFNTDGKTTRIPTHSLPLAINSAVFRAMLKRTELQVPTRFDDIQIDEVPATAFCEFLKFIYFGQLAMSMEYIADLVYLGEKYNVAPCQKDCIAFLMHNAKIVHNMCEVYGIAIQYNYIEVMKTCEKEIKAKTSAVLKSTGFLNCDHTVLKSILQLDALACREVELFHACVAWVKTMSKTDKLTKDVFRFYIGDLLYDINFGAMKDHEFSSLMLQYGELFSIEEIEDITQTLASNDVQSKLFKQNRR